jgi:hypothetical protein
MQCIRLDCRRAARRSSLDTSRPSADATGQAAKISLDGTESLYHSKVPSLLCCIAGVSNTFAAAARAVTILLCLSVEIRPCG